MWLAHLAIRNHYIELQSGLYSSISKCLITTHSKRNLWYTVLQCKRMHSSDHMYLFRVGYSQRNQEGLYIHESEALMYTNYVYYVYM